MLDCCRLGAALALLLCLSAPLAAQTPNGQGTYQPQLTPQQEAARLRAQQEALAQSNQAAAPPVSMQMPPGFPLPADHAQYVESLLDHWQKVSQQVQMYKCSFRRFEYDTTYVQYRDPQTQMLAAHLVGFGEVRYAAPDRARFETHKLMRFKNPPQTPGGNAEYEVVDGYTTGTQTIHERWVCDGKSILDFDFEQKRMYETTIPPQLQGNIVESPLPFLFGANKQDILNKYWVRYVPKYITDANGQKQLNQDEYWLEAYPKKINDSRMYSKLEIILSAKDFMPKAMHLYSPQYNPAKGNYTSRYFLFEDRQINGQLAKMQDFFGSFVKPRMPLGWKTVTRQMGQSQSAALPPGTHPGGEKR